MTVLDLIARHEGSRAEPYHDSLGILTVGVGHNLQANPLPGEVYPMSPERIQAVLAADLEREGAPVRALPWFPALDEVRQAVLLDMAFNMGAAGLLSFHNTLGHFERGEWDAAADGMLASKWAAQVGPRAIEDAEMVRTGCWPACGSECLA